MNAIFPQLPSVACVCLPVREAAQATEALRRQADALQFADVRRNQFLAGRMAAAQALSELAAAVQTVARSADGAPQWPPAVVGSIAHEAAWAIAVAAREQDWCALGVDVEADIALPEDAASVVLTDSERTWLAKAHSAEPLQAAKLLFSAKECVHKAIQPLRGAWLEFDEVQVHFHAGHFTVTPVSALAQQAFAGLECQGHYTRVDGMLYTLLTVRRPTP